MVITRHGSTTSGDNTSDSNMDTKTILDSMQEMKTSILKAREEKDELILAKISSIEDTLTGKVNANTERIDTLETKQSATTSDVENLVKDLELEK